MPYQAVTQKNTKNENTEIQERSFELQLYAGGSRGYGYPATCCLSYFYSLITIPDLPLLMILTLSPDVICRKKFP